MRTSRSLSTCTVRARDQLEQVAVGILEVDAAATVVVIDLARHFLMRVGPDRNGIGLDPSERGVEVILTHEEGVVLRCEVVGMVHVVERDLADLHGHERPPLRSGLDTEYVREKRGRRVRVARMNDRVVELDAHVDGRLPSIVATTPPSGRLMIIPTGRCTSVWSN